MLFVGALAKNFKIIGRNKSVALGNYFEESVENGISEGLYKNSKEVIDVGLRLLEEEENSVITLKTAIKDGPYIDVGKT